MERYNANMLVMPACLTDMYVLGTKFVTIHSENSKLNLPRSRRGWKCDGEPLDPLSPRAFGSCKVTS